MAHEVGHLLNLWHVSDPNNVMYPDYSATSHELTSFQCCLLKRSPFVTYV
jgi:predicted Zn-dependent protease